MWTIICLLVPFLMAIILPVHYITCPLYYLSIVLPVHCITCPLYYLSIVLPVHCITCPLYYLSIVLPVHCITCPLYYLSIILPVLRQLTASDCPFDIFFFHTKRKNKNLNNINIHRVCYFTLVYFILR